MSGTTLPTAANASFTSPARPTPGTISPKTTTGHAISFYETAFAGYNDGPNLLPPSDQIWQLKELFECVALAGFILLFVPLMMLLMKLPFLAKAKTGVLRLSPAAAPCPQDRHPGTGTVLRAAAGGILPRFDGWQHRQRTLMILTDAGALFGLVGLAAIFLSGKSTVNVPGYRTAIVAALSGFGLMWVSSHNFLSNTTPSGLHRRSTRSPTGPWSAP